MYSSTVAMSDKPIPSASNDIDITSSSGNDGTFNGSHSTHTSSSGIFIKEPLGGQQNNDTLPSTNLNNFGNGGNNVHFTHPEYDSMSTPHQGMSKFRRDSLAHLQGMGGVSWGSLNIGSWLKEEVSFHATLKHSRTHESTYNGSAVARRLSHVSHTTPGQSSTSPPISYSAYLPNLEKQYCKDYSCCGLSLPSLHDLLKHYEETHISVSPGNTTSNPSMAGSNTAKGYQNRKKSVPSALKNSSSQEVNTSTSNNGSSSANNSQMQQSTIPTKSGSYDNSNFSAEQRQANSQKITQHMEQQQHQPNISKLIQPHQQFQEMNLDSNLLSMKGYSETPVGPFQRKNSQIPQLHLNGNLIDAVSTNEVFLSPFATQSKNKGNNNNSNINKRNETSFSPNSTFQQMKLNPNNNMHNDMDMSFMDPDMMINPYSNNHHDISFMGLPGNLVPPTNFQSNTQNTLYPNMSTLSQQMSQTTHPLISNQANHQNDDDDDDDNDDDDDDEDHMTGFSGHNNYNKNMQNKSNTLEGYIDDPARRLYVMDHEEHKPFKCPVIGCEKTYKNQNGLKYHKLHGHQNQKLQENPDGTISILDPDSNEPFAEGMGNEKDKPYRCEVCGKRYKNLNGLKYHRGHSTH